MGSSKIFWAIIIGAVIISAGLYFGYLTIDRGLQGDTESKNKLVAFLSTDKNATTIASVNEKTSGDRQIPPITTKCGAENSTIVTKVIVGDTVVVEGGFHIRLLGMDADGNGYSCYELAKTRLEQLVLGKKVVLEKDITDLDQYGRCLRYIFIGGDNITVQLVKEGLAVARFYEPDTKYRPEITGAEKQAQTNNTGYKWAK